MRRPVAEFLQGTPRRMKGPPPRRLGLLDLLLVVGVCTAVVGRTPVGALAWYVGQRVRGVEMALPSLTATFSHGMVAAPAGEVVLPPVEGPALEDGQLPEPWRTALSSALAGGVPERVGARLAAEGHAPTVVGALAYVDALGEPVPERAIERLVMGDELLERAVARARAAGQPDPETYDVHRLYLPGDVRLVADRVVGASLAVGTVLDLGWPVATPHRVTSGFGVRVHPTLKTRKFHNGIDLGVPIGTPVLAPQDGIVETVAHNGTSGNYVIVDHGHGVRTSYCHLDGTDVERGDAVSRGEQLATSGNTGRSTGPHLHYIVRIAGDAVDPARFRANPEK